MKKILIWGLTLAMAAAIFSGCGKCAHQWTPATCSAPETCSVCGETKGETLPHTWAEANYQQPSTCSVCGAVQGEPLTPGFEAHGLVCAAEYDTPYPYVTVCVDGDAETTGSVVWSDFAVIEPDETHPALEGYEWVTLTLTMTFSDSSARDYGVQWQHLYEDYYDIEKHDGTLAEVPELSDGDEVYAESFTVNYYGRDYDQCLRVDNYLESGWSGDNVFVRRVKTDYRVPAGYDGMVSGVGSAARLWAEGEYIYDIADDSFIFLRVR